tara:strand:- start:335 stop:667 length:333 start_codon:yes stop_codon:yes gene_type:complete
MTITKDVSFDSECTRYFWDNSLVSKGFAQIDTAEDASWYGHWACPKRRKLVGFVEGDITITVCTTDKEFISEVRKTCDWHIKYDQFKGIDPPALTKHLWVALGLTEFLYK